MVETDIYDLANFIVKEGLKLGVDEIATLVNKTVKRQARFSNNQITVTKTWDDIAIKVYVAKDRRIAMCEVTNMEKNSLKENLNKLLHVIKITREVEGYEKLPEGPFTYKSLPDTYDPKIEQLGEEIVDFAEEAINSALNAGGKRVAGTLYSEYNETVLVTSRNVEAKDKGTRIEITVRSFADEEGVAQGMGLSVSRTLGKFNPSKAGEKAGETSKMSLNPASGKPGTYNVIFGPYSFANLLDFASMAFSAFYVESGLSPLADKLNQQVAPEEVTIVDDPHLPNGYNSRPFDDEGVPTRRNELVKNGVVETFLHNVKTAKKFKTKTTGNAGWIVPHAWNIVFEPGNRTFNELLEDVKNDILIENTWYTRFQNYRTGDFSTIPRDGIFLIENGEIKSAIRGIRVSDNILKLFNNISGFTKEVEQVHWWEIETPVITPYVAVKDVKITTATK